MDFSDEGRNSPENFSMSEAIGQSEAFLEFQEQVSAVAPIDRPVLILGERGTGKELAATRIHYLSKRWEKPFVTLNCSALTPTLIGSELFGHEKGAFTGAVANHSGRFEKASEGTLFLDEIGSIPMEVQEKILRVVEYKSFERVGGSASLYADVRIVAAANVDLALLAKTGRFKQDLLDRLSFEVIYVPPLRNRQEDIMILSSHFAHRMAFELKRSDVPEFTKSAIKALEEYVWPGNVRELKNVIERAVYKSKSYKIAEISFDPFISPYSKYLEPVLPLNKNFQEADVKRYESNKPVQNKEFMDSLLEKSLKEAVKDLEFTMLTKALKKSHYNQKKAAKVLGLSYDQFRGLKKKYDF
ncbi:MAG: phage shock protein operon transcriptional activator [Desulfobacteraceae bacterium]|nr:phage shock protein operon transcriptional activator [Desulfobacteraceae bacterium]